MRPARGSTDSDRYGPWAVVTGGAEGLGWAFARKLAGDGRSLLLVDRKAGPLREGAVDLADRTGAEVRPLVADLATRAGVEATTRAAEDLGVGLLVCSAGLAPIGPFLDQRAEDLEEALATNCRAPLLLSHSIGRQMSRRRRGGIVLVSSLSGLQGTAMVAAYAATKAFDLVLGEGLWEELRHEGVDVLSVCLGPTRTPGWERSRPRLGGLLAPRVMEPEAVVDETLAALGRGPSAVMGGINRVTAQVTRRLLPRRLVVAAMGRATRELYPPEREERFSRRSGHERAGG